METTAEGIEALDTLSLMKQLGVSHVQGYVFSQPMDADAVRERMAKGPLDMQPDGPDTHRSDRKTLLRKIGLIHEDHRYEVTMRNLSKTGCMVEGLLEVPLDTQFVVDFGEGQLAVALVRRSNGQGTPRGWGSAGARWRWCFGWAPHGRLRARAPERRPTRC